MDASNMALKIVDLNNASIFDERFVPIGAVANGLAILSKASGE
jgi:hypothetical protein